MAESVTMSRRHAAASSTSMGVSVFTGCCRCLLLLVVALLLSIVIEWAGMLFLWPEQGTGHSRAMLETEAGYLTHLHASDTVLAEAVNSLMLGVMATVERLIRWTQLERLATVSIDVVRLASVSAIHMVQVFALRLLVLLLSLPTFVLFGVAGFVRGVMRRDLRRWGGGRESSGMFHLYSRLMPASFVGVWFLYLSMPISINPFWLIGPAALLFALLVSGVAYRFKKYV